jgi:predicted ATPase
MALALCPIVVGRDEELRVLDDALDGVAVGRGTCVVVTGEAGIGKSRYLKDPTRLA